MFNTRGGFSAEGGVPGLHNQARAENQAQEYYKFTTFNYSASQNTLREPTIIS